MQRKGTLDTFNGRHVEAMARDRLSDMLSADATLE